MIQDSCFTSNYWKALWEFLGTKVLFTSTYYPQRDGQVERPYYRIKQALRCFLIELNFKQSRWVELFPFVEFDINASVQDSIGLNPKQLVFGQVLWAAVDLVEGLHPIEAAQSWDSEVQNVVE